jgi:hypothetical protein
LIANKNYWKLNIFEECKFSFLYELNKFETFYIQDCDIISKYSFNQWTSSKFSRKSAMFYFTYCLVSYFEAYPVSNRFRIIFWNQKLSITNQKSKRILYLNLQSKRKILLNRWKACSEKNFHKLIIIIFTIKCLTVNFFFENHHLYLYNIFSTINYHFFISFDRFTVIKHNYYSMYIFLTIVNLIMEYK